MLGSPVVASRVSRARIGIWVRSWILICSWKLEWASHCGRAFVIVVVVGVGDDNVRGAGDR